MRWIRITGVLILAALIQGAVLPAVEIGRARPELLLLLALYIAAHERPGRGSRWGAFWVGWIAGLLQDIHLTGVVLPFAATALVYGGLALALHRLGTELFLDSILAQILVLLPAVLVARVALALVLVVVSAAPAGPALSLAWRTSVYSALVAPLVFLALRPLERFLLAPSQRTFSRA